MSRGNTGNARQKDKPILLYQLLRYSGMSLTELCLYMHTLRASQSIALVLPRWRGPTRC